MAAAQQLRVEPSNAVVVEDALSEVQVGRRGGFGLVIGVARHGDSEELKKHGAGFEAQEVSMDFHYDNLEETNMLIAYERLLLDCMKSDATLFTRTDAVRACWEFIQPILDFKDNCKHLYGYAVGTWGPKEADELLKNDGHDWRFPCKNLANTDYCEL